MSMLFLIVLFLQTPSLLVVGSLVPLVGGVVLASMTEVSFNWLVVILPLVNIPNVKGLGKH